MIGNCNKTSPVEIRSDKQRARHEDRTHFVIIPTSRGLRGRRSRPHAQTIKSEENEVEYRCPGGNSDQEIGLGKMSDHCGINSAPQWNCHIRQDHRSGHPPKTTVCLRINPPRDYGPQDRASPRRQISRYDASNAAVTALPSMTDDDAN